jgi:type I restriction enzyme, R subunit
MFSDEQIQWLGMMRDHIATSLEIDMDSFDLTPFTNEGGLARASTVFGKDLKSIVQELNEVLAA